MQNIYSSHSLSCVTDLYEINMAYGYWKKEMVDDEAVFLLFFRRKTFNGGFTIAAGLESVIEYLKSYRFTEDDCAYLASLTGENGEPLYDKKFLKFLNELRFSCDIDAVVEGEVVFPFEPLLRVQGPLIQCQLLESVLLTLMNFASLIATKAARMCLAAKGDPVIEFGLRRAQGIDGALTASRSSFIGGCTATSNVLAGKLFGIPVKGTHAHSWVLAFGSELEAFQASAETMPANCIFLVDTFDTLQGVKHAIEIGKQLATKGYKLSAIRLDSGDLAYLSIKSRKLLDDAGFTETAIIASNELDETLIADLKNQGAPIAIWGVGTHLVTGYSQPALDGVYKLSAMRKKGKPWEYKLKLSEQMSKISNPGILQVIRYEDEQNGYIGDMIFDVEKGISSSPCMIDPVDHTRQKSFHSSMKHRYLLKPIFRQGKCIYSTPALSEIQTYARQELAKFDRTIKRLYNPHAYPVGLEESYYRTKIELIEKVRKQIRV